MIPVRAEYPDWTEGSRLRNRVSIDQMGTALWPGLVDMMWLLAPRDVHIPQIRRCSDREVVYTSHMHRSCDISDVTRSTYVLLEVDVDL